jgi:hypothetical protein
MAASEIQALRVRLAMLSVIMDTYLESTVYINTNESESQSKNLIIFRAKHGTLTITNRRDIGMRWGKTPVETYPNYAPPRRHEGQLVKNCRPLKPSPTGNKWLTVEAQTGAGAWSKPAASAAGFPRWFAGGGAGFGCPGWLANPSQV